MTFSLIHRKQYGKPAVFTKEETSAFKGIQVDLMMVLERAKNIEILFHPPFYLFSITKIISCTILAVTIFIRIRLYPVLIIIISGNCIIIIYTQ